MKPCIRQVLRSVFTVTAVSKALWVVMYTMNNYTMRDGVWQLTCKALYPSCSETKDTTQSLSETLVGLLKSTVAIKSAVDALDVLQCSKAVAKFELHQTVKVACSSV